MRYLSDGELLSPGVVTPRLPPRQVSAAASSPQVSPPTLSRHSKAYSHMYQAYHLGTQKPLVRARGFIVNNCHDISMWYPILNRCDGLVRTETSIGLSLSL